MNDGYLKTTKINFPAKHSEVLEIYKAIYNLPNADEYSMCIGDINPDDCWFKIEPEVSNHISNEDKTNLKTYLEAISLGMKIDE